MDEGHLSAHKQRLAIGDDCRYRGDPTSAIDDPFFGVIATYKVSLGSQELRKVAVDRP